MKRITSIFLIFILLLNVMGYYGLFLGLKYTYTLQVRHRLDNESYNQADEIILKIPLAIPYCGNTEFERVDGEIEHNGEFYRLVKQKIVNDTLYVVCISDINNQRIHYALTECVKTFSDQSADHSNLNIIPSFIKHCISASISLLNVSAGWRMAIHHFNIEDPAANADLINVSPPPEA